MPAKPEVPPNTQTPAVEDVSPVKVVSTLVLAWLVPGAGHLSQGRLVRGVTFLALVCFSVAVGSALDGKLFTVQAGSPLSTLGTLASLGAGIPYMVLRWIMDYQGDMRAATYEYGGAFLLTAGLMNLLAMLDAWDVLRGRKP